ncbi:transcriptional regulator [Aliidiomarina minuta]|uniref:Transcriptional regulator n=1 Tax=Aliidiomarina minuta TaxID=880057 RepID=A0A432W7K6_9GAMM|nr:P-II family nitrogen regulator [Aliidiomarina minuta]RUO26064.1 transcriptional regulator [Aliidiomarina minuta]
MKFKLLMAFVDVDKTEKLIDTARKAGATGATIITSAKGVGLKEAIGIFGFQVHSQRDVVLVLVEERRADDVLAQVVKVGGLDERLDTGIALLLDVDKALGLSEHVKLLEAQIPFDPE